MMPSTNPLSARGLRPAAELAAGRAHGDRLRYVAGCRCNLCRAANSTYERTRQAARLAGDWNGIVPAGKALAHMSYLSAQGIGRRAIAEASDVSQTVLVDIRAGRKTKIRARTERHILAVTVDMALDHALIPASATWALIEALLKAGFTKQVIAEGIGQTNGALQLSHEQVTVRNADKIRKLYARLIDSDEALTNAKRTWRLLEQLRDEGYTDKQLCRHLGLPDDELQISRARISLRMARLVEQVHERLTT